jgi:hypothetical protein
MNERPAPRPQGTLALRTPKPIQSWGLFAAALFLLTGLTLAFLQAGPVAGRGPLLRYAFWLSTAAATFGCWWLSQWLVVSGRDRLTRGLLVRSSFVATLLFVPLSLALDPLFALTEVESSWLSLVIEEWLAGAFPVFSSCLIASLPAWLATADTPSAAAAPPPPDPARASADCPEAEPDAAQDTPASDPAGDPAGGRLLPLAVRGGVLRATADLQYVHLHSADGVTTVPGPMHRVIGLLADQGLEVRRGEWIADRHIRQVKSVRGQWVVLLKDGGQVTVSRRRLAEVRNRWGSTRFS